MIEKLYKIFLKNPVVSTDSRNIPQGSIFFALKGENFNGNKFAREALKKGAAFAVVDELDSGTDKRFIQVESVLETLQELAQHHRSQLGIRIIGITGTNGKTTTKELVQCVLKKKYKSYATIGNLNNHIGVPLTLLSLSKNQKFAVIEMGANHIGEIAELCKIALPDYGLITNIGKAHLEGFGGFEGVIKAKSELYYYIRETGGTIFINADNDLLLKHAVGIKNVSYGKKEEVNCRGEIVNDFPFLELNCTINGEFFHVKSKLIGRYNFENIMAAVCIGNYFNVAISDIEDAIESYEPNNNRSQIIQTKNNMLILDAYNANPSSMKAAIENFAKGDFEKKVLVLGDMAELGIDSPQEHLSILEFVRSSNFKDVILVGPEFMNANQSFGYTAINDKEQLKDFIKGLNLTNATILIKGSRKMQLEQITPTL